MATHSGVIGKVANFRPEQVANISPESVANFDRNRCPTWSGIRSRAQKESTRLNVPLVDMLAEIIAYEVGHVFLGPNSHSPSGIMAAKWKPRDLIAISQGGYGFTRQQRELIQTEVRRRQAQQTASGLRPIR